MYVEKYKEPSFVCDQCIFEMFRSNKHACRQTQPISVVHNPSISRHKDSVSGPISGQCPTLYTEYFTPQTLRGLFTVGTVTIVVVSSLKVHSSFSQFAHM